MAVRKAGTVLVFGVFDGLHEGHRFFLARAREHGERLVAVVACDQAVQELKGRTPRQSETERLAAVRRVAEVDKAVLGDAVQGSYEALKTLEPEVICCGYDQDALERDLKRRMAEGTLPGIAIVRLAKRRP